MLNKRDETENVSTESVTVLTIQLNSVATMWTIATFGTYLCTNKTHSAQIIAIEIYICVYCIYSF